VSLKTYQLVRPVGDQMMTGLYLLDGVMSLTDLVSSIVQSERKHVRKLP